MLCLSAAASRPVPRQPRRSQALGGASDQHGWSSAADVCRRRRRRLGRPAAASSGSGGDPQTDQAVQQSTATTATTTAPRPSSRLFSNVHPETLVHTPGTVWGAAALIAGTTVGAGVLALPATTATSGFVASSVGLVGAWGYSVVTGLLLAEVNLSTLCELGAGRGVSLSSMARRTLGDGGAAAVSLVYAGLHYAMLVAYIAKAGEAVQQISGLPLPAADAAFAAGFAALCYFASPSVLDKSNAVLVAAVVAAFLALVGMAATDLRPELLAAADWGALPDALPILVLSLVYHNVIPSVAASLEGDAAKIRQAIVLGLSLPLAMFLVWDGVVLGSSGGALLLEAGAAAGGDPLAALRATSPEAAGLVDAFAFLAVATSFIGFLLGLTEFIADALQLPTGARAPLPYLLALAPPLAGGILYPGAFFTALDFAGTYGVLVLFGIVPVAMAWSERYGGSTLARFELVPGGRPALVAVGCAAGAVILRELLQVL